jgi:threonylcarbamoyladenosine tRNA methylthiotransferase MtaB
MQKYLLKTLGCKANLVDSRLIEAELKKQGWAPATEGHGEEAALCIINSCTVTDEADKQSRQMAARIARDFPNAKIVMTGCGAEVDPEKMANSKGIDFVVGNQDKPEMVDLVLKALEAPSRGLVKGEILGGVENYREITSRHPMDRDWPSIESQFLSTLAPGEGAAGRKRAFLKVQEGCNSFCTYCIIPYGRGPARSLPITDVVRQVNELVSAGYREVVITGTNVGDYGVDWAPKPMVDELLEAILRDTKISRLRVSSLDPTEISGRMLDLMKSEPRFCPHFHVSLQSPHSRILKLMKRKYRWEEVKACLEKIAALPAPEGGAYIGMDVITGFPGETDEEFQWTYEALKELPWTRLHVFPYSERTGTPATKLPDSVSRETRMKRARLLRELSFKRMQDAAKKVVNLSRRSARPLETVLLEGVTKGPDQSSKWLAGYTSNYYRVLVPMTPEIAKQRKELENTLVTVEPIDVTVDRASGDAAILGRLRA